MLSYQFLRDQKFWTGLLDVIVSLALYFVGKYAGESVFADVKFVIAALQPVFVLVIVGLFQTEQALLRSGEFPRFMRKK